MARAFLIAEPAMAQRLVRTKRKIKLARIPYRVPREHELPDRLRAVLAVISTPQPLPRLELVLRPGGPEVRLDAPRRGSGHVRS